MIDSQDPESNDESDSSSENEANQHNSNPSDYDYKPHVVEKKTWNKFATTLEGESSASEQNTDFYNKAHIFLKIIITLIVFGVNLVAGVVSKGTLLFITAQVCNLI